MASKRTKSNGRKKPSRFAKNKRRVTLASRLTAVWDWLWSRIRPQLPHAWRLWPLALLLLTSVVLVHEFRTQNRFRLNEIELPVCRHLSQAALQSYLHTRIGQNIFSVDLEGAAARIVSHPWIRTATVRRSLPDKLVVEASEHEAVALLQLEALYLVDVDGEPFKKHENGDPADLPLLTGFSVEAFAGGHELAAKREAKRIAQAVALLKRCETGGPITPAQISEVHFDAINGYSLVRADSGAQVRLGYGKYDLKLRRYRQLQQRLRGRLQQANLIDLVIPDRVLVRGLREGTGA